MNRKQLFLAILYCLILIGSVKSLDPGLDVAASAYLDYKEKVFVDIDA